MLFGIVHDKVVRAVAYHVLRRLVQRERRADCDYGLRVLDCEPAQRPRLGDSFTPGRLCGSVGGPYDVPEHPETLLVEVIDADQGPATAADAQCGKPASPVRVDPDAWPFGQP